MSVAHGVNDTRFDDLMAKAKELGIAAGQGKDTLVKFATLVVNSAYDGVLDTIKHKHGDTVDDAVKVYTEYSRAMVSATVFDHKTPSGKVQSAKMRTMVRLGKWTRGGPGEPIRVMNLLLAMRDKMRRTPGEAKLLDDAYNTLLRFARFQIKQTSVCDDPAALRAFCMKGVSPTKTLEDYIEGVAKRLGDLKEGRAERNTLQHSSPTIVNVITALRNEVQTLRAKHDQDDD